MQNFITSCVITQNLALKDSIAKLQVYKIIDCFTALRSIRNDKGVGFRHCEASLEAVAIYNDKLLLKIPLQMLLYA
ncbi:hypothetical protein [Helicobacter sp.]|uniref:hypothetical protein n=1 Tax=Helicobacter sp. TaxID=218 RepID=UPI0025C146B4|nr:hypothetical protein [Helicobacter sp.]MCI5633534.1 hypothetical protein [Helicobacter sp.]